ncbi:MAG: GspH/FimT family pseudopilin [Rhodanobacter sp.]
MDGTSLKKQAGVTLVELITTLIVLAVLAGIALPSMSGLMHRHRLQAAENEYIAILQYARSTAITDNTRIIFCPSRDAQHCSNDGDWTQGWLVGRNLKGVDQPDGEPLRVGSPADRQLTIVSTAGRQLVHFQSNGNADGSNLSLLFCYRGDSNDALSVVVAKSGRIRGAEATNQQAANCAAAK